MKTHGIKSLLPLLCLALASLNPSLAQTTSEQPLGVPGKWVKTFDSNFSQANALNAFNLTIDRLGNHTYSGNGEQEWYEASQLSITRDPVNGSLLNMVVSPNQIYINNNGSIYYNSGYYYPSGAVCTKYFAQVGGVFEIRCKMPNGGETWPAFWLLNGTVGNQSKNTPGVATLPNHSEIDIFELLGSGQSNSGDYTPAKNWFHVDWHNDDASPNVSEGGWINVSKFLAPGQTLVNSFHTYSASLVPNQSTKIYFDGNLVYTDSNPIMTKGYPYYILTNLAYGGTWGGQGLPIAPSSGTVSGSDFQVQYIRAYQQATGAP